MRSWSFLPVLPLLMVLARPALGCSQCMCGMPFPADALGGVVPMQVRYGLEDRYLAKSNDLEEEEGREEEREHRICPFILWRPASRWALLARVPFNVKKIQEQPAAGPAETRKARGLGDVELLALFGVAQRSGATLGAVFGVTAPTGSNGLRDETGERLDVHLQPGTGAWSLTAGVNLGWTTRRGSLESGLLARRNAESSRGYHYGNAWLYNLGYASRTRHGVSLLFQVNGRTADHDRFEDGAVGENTGGTVVYLTPGFRWHSTPDLDLELTVQEPIVESLFGHQDERTVGRLAVSLSR